MNNDGSSFKDFCEIKKCKLKNRLSKLKNGFQTMYGRSRVLNDLIWKSIYKVGEKLAISSHFARNLPYSVNWIVFLVDYMELVVTVLFDRANGSNFKS